MKSKREPTYDLSEIQRLVANEQYLISTRVRKCLVNHGYDPVETVKDVIESIQPENFYKSDELRNCPGVQADIYHHVQCYKDLWYVKYFENSEGEATVTIWSLKEDGYSF